VGARASAAGDPDRRTVGHPPATAIARPGHVVRAKARLIAPPEGAAAASRSRRRSVPDGDRRFFRAHAGSAVDANPADREARHHRAHALGPSWRRPRALGVVSPPAGARRHCARDEAERQAAASRPVPFRVRQGAALRQSLSPHRADALGVTACRRATMHDCCRWEAFPWRALYRASGELVSWDPAALNELGSFTPCSTASSASPESLG
jgi:hypothetical protein